MNPNQLSPEEVAEAQRMGIVIPGMVGRPLPRALAATLGHESGLKRAPVGGIPGPLAPVGRRPLPSGPDYVPRVELSPTRSEPSPLAKSLAESRKRYTEQLDRLDKPTDYSQLSDQMRQRSAAGMDDMYASALAGLGPEAVRGFQQPLLKQALAARQPLQVEGGQIDDQGRVMIDPAFQKNKQAEQLRQKLAEIDRQERQIMSDDQRTALSHERNMVLLLMQQLRDANGMSGKGGASTWGYTPKGERIIEDRQGNQWVEQPDGSRIRYMGPGIQKGPFERNVQGSMDLQGSVNRADQLIQLAEANPDSFGIVPALVAMTPSIVQSRLMPKVLTPEQQTARNYIQRQAAEEIHQIYGAALTMGEGRRAAQWAIEPGEGIESVLAKLKSARDWASQTMMSKGSAANEQARQRLGNSQTPTPTPAAGSPGAIPPGWSVKEVKPR